MGTGTSGQQGEGMGKRASPELGQALGTQHILHLQVARELQLAESIQTRRWDNREGIHTQVPGDGMGWRGNFNHMYAHNTATM